MHPSPMTTRPNGMATRQQPTAPETPAVATPPAMLPESAGARRLRQWFEEAVTGPFPDADTWELNLDRPPLPPPPESPDGPATPIGLDAARNVPPVTIEPPLGSEVLAQVPDLEALLIQLREIDRLVAISISHLALLMETGLAERLTGVGLDTWLSIVARRTGSDIRMLRTTVAVMRRVPSLREAFRTQQVSWCQVRSIVLAVHRLPGHLDDRIDQAVAEGIAGACGAEPDAVTRAIRWALVSLEPTTQAEEQATAEQQEYLGMQPHADRPGGRMWAELGPRAWALADAALNRDLPPPPGPARKGFAGDPLERPAGEAMRTLGQARLRRFLDILEGTDSSSRQEPSGQSSGQGKTATGPRKPSPPQLIVRAELSTLLRRDEVPARLLTHLLGGHVLLTAEAARRLLDERGADLRTVILDDTGRVVGVGRKTRRPPEFLKDAARALHDTCAAPNCETSVLLCDLDHAIPWKPRHPDAPAGRTDIDQLAPLCTRDNVAKERDGWRATQLADGTRRWSHERTGLTTRTLPAEWRAPPRAGPA